MAEEEKEKGVRLRTYNEYMTGQIPRKGEDKQDMSKVFWTKASMFLVFGLVFLCLIIFFPQDSLSSLVMLAVIDAICFFAFAANLYVYWKSGSPEEGQSGEVTFRCRHCGKGFSNEKVGKRHESSCVEMKI